jgi:hypothetical protein
LLVSVGLSGCNQISSLFLTDEDKLIGTWNSDGIWGDLPIPTDIMFSPNGTFKSTFHISGIQTTSDGIWDINDGVITMEIVDVNSPTSYTYKFSDDSRTLTLTPIHGTDAHILRKQ